jgi:GNAT superfamily N-acetyltransferase
MDIEELAIPSQLDDSRAARDFVAAVEVANAVERARVGSDEFIHAAEEVFATWRHLDTEPKRMFVVRDGGEIVGRATLEWRDSAAVSEYSWQEIEVHPDHQGRGIGRALADHLEGIARATGKGFIVAMINSRFGPGPELKPKNGLGSLPAEDRDVRFLVRRGFELEQVLRYSRFALPGDRELLRRLREDADAKAGPDYRIVHWANRTPAEWEQQMLIQRQRLWDDIPLAGVPYPGENDPGAPWTIERYRDEEETFLAGGSALLVGAAIHIPSGTVAGYTQLIVPAEPTRPLSQGATHVLGEHRGHRLSMLLKIANIQQLEDHFPGRPAITVINHENNRFMLEVNEKMHFEPVFPVGSWVKRL